MHENTCRSCSCGRCRQRLAMTTIVEQAEFDHLEGLLPWYASGKLTPEDVLHVERALARMPELRRRYDLILEERAASVNMHESLGTPSPRALERLFAQIESAAAEAPKSRRVDVGRWLAERFSNWQPSSLALAGMAVAFLLSSRLACSRLCILGRQKMARCIRRPRLRRQRPGRMGHSS